MQLNAEQIKKALECFTRGRKSKEDMPCLECDYNECNIVGGTSERQTTGTCQGWLMKDALSLINQLTAEVDKLGKALDKMSAEHDRAIRLTEVYTVRNMRDKVKKAILSVNYNLSGLLPFIDQIANEMLEDASCNNTCISCGEINPEGRQICPNCEIMSNKEEGDFYCPFDDHYYSQGERKENVPTSTVKTYIDAVLSDDCENCTRCHIICKEDNICYKSKEVM